MMRRTGRRYQAVIRPYRWNAKPSTGAATRSDARPLDSYAIPRGVIVLLGTAGIVVSVAGLRALADLAAPVMLALMVTVTVSPLTGWLCRRWGVWIGVGVTVVIVYGGLILLVASMVISVTRLVDLVPTYQNELADLRDDLSVALRNLGVDEAQTSDVTQRVEPGAIAGLAQSLLGGVAGMLSNLVLLVAVLFFMCLDAAHFPARLAVSATQRPHVVGALRSFAQGTRRYLLVSTVFGLIVAVIDTLALWALGIPLPVLWGLLAFITNYIPNVGFFIGLVPPALLGLLEGGPQLMAVVIVLYCVINFVLQSIIQPKIVGDAVGLSTTVSFLSLVFWAWVIGPLGALLAVPLTLLAKALLVDIDPATRWIEPLVSAGRPSQVRP
ncbi:MAG TPA: AI-2E family transporter [Pilimelia sp.]|nr:AI-2E family transporter [Pilimelia sp.]